MTGDEPHTPSTPAQGRFMDAWEVEFPDLDKSAGFTATRVVLYLYARPPDPQLQRMGELARQEGVGLVVALRTDENAADGEVLYDEAAP